MPEAPEAEVNRARVEKGALNRTIEAVRLGNDTSHIELPSKSDRDRFVGTQLTKTHRHGKIILFGSASGPWVAVHLGMTGSLRVWDEHEPAPSHMRIVWEFRGGRRLGFRCPRKLGWVRVADSVEDWLETSGWGPDVLDIGRAAFRDVIGGTRGALKSALLDQKKMAGVGNLWSDETLFQTGHRPDTRADSLTPDDLATLHAAVQRIIRRVMDKGAEYSRLPDDWLIHRRKAGADCPLCEGKLAKLSVGGRTSYFCPAHQRGD